MTEAQRVRCPRTSFSPLGEREVIKKSFSISRLLEKEPSEELSDIAGEDTAEAIE